MSKDPTSPKFSEAIKVIVKHNVSTAGYSREDLGQGGQDALSKTFLAKEAIKQMIMKKMEELKQRR